MCENSLSVKEWSEAQIKKVLKSNHTRQMYAEHKSYSNRPASFWLCDAFTAETRVSCYKEEGGIKSSAGMLFPPFHSPLIVPSITSLAFAWLSLWWSTSLRS